MTDPTDKGRPATAPTDPKARREARLAQALRLNLRRRKAAADPAKSGKD